MSNPFGSEKRKTTGAEERKTKKCLKSSRLSLVALVSELHQMLLDIASKGLKIWVGYAKENKEETPAILKRCYDRGLHTSGIDGVCSNSESEKLLGEFLRK